MPEHTDYLALDDDALLAQCDVHITKASGPGGQHRNKVSSAVRMKHRPTGVTAQGEDSRSQHENRRAAIGRLRMNLACRLRRAATIADGQASVPPVVSECTFAPRGQGKPPRLEVGRRDRRFWSVAAFLLDVLDTCEGRLSTAAAAVGITTSNLSTLLKSERHLLTAAQQIRRNHNCKPLT